MRERNLQFLALLGDALQLDRIQATTWSSVKQAITPTSVRKINEAVLQVWPPQTDIAEALVNRSNRQLGFFSGDYRPDRLASVVARHTVYADVVGLADPFIYPFSLREEFNPLLHPEKHLTNTAKALLVWFRLAPMIVEGLVEIIRLPSDFDPVLNRHNLKECKRIFEQNEELSRETDRLVEQHLESDNYENQEWFALMQSDEQLRRSIKDVDPGISDENAEELLNQFRIRRREHPFYVESSSNELISETTGSNVFDSIHVAKLTEGYMLTDLSVRWMQMKAVALESGLRVDDRTRVAHSLQELSLPQVKSLDIEFAIRLRQDQKLRDVRDLLDRFMRSASSNEALSEQEARAFELEFSEALRQAKDEYQKIDEDLLKYLGAEVVATTGLFGISGGSLSLSLGGIAVASAFNFFASRMRRKSFVNRYPAALFMHRK